MESLLSTVNLYILQLCRKLYHLHWYVPRSISPTLTVYRLQRYEKKKLQTIFLEMCFENFGKFIGKAV